MNIHEILKLTNSKGLGIIEETIIINDSGVDFSVAHAKDINGNTWILRFPRRPGSMRHALKEKNALDILNANECF